MNNKAEIRQESKIVSVSCNIYQKINAVMGDVSYIQKEDKKVNNQYRFVSHDAVVGALNKSFVKYGIVVIPSIKSYSQDGNKTIVDMTVKFINIDNPQDFVSIDYFGFGIDQGDKGPGKAITYAYKYALLKTFCLETGEQDPEYTANTKYEPKKEEEKPEKKDEVKPDVMTEELDKFIKDHFKEEAVYFKVWMEDLRIKKKELTYEKCLKHFSSSLDLAKKAFSEWKEANFKN